MRNLIVIVLFLGLCTVSCDQNRVFETNLAMKDAQWERSQIAKFDIAIDDTLAYYSIFINLRNSGQYPYRNIYLFSKIKSPDGKYARDTSEFILADAKGKWLGKGIGDLWEHQFLYKKGVQFPTSGEYIIELEQAMRDKELKYITDVGVRVEKISNNQ